MAVSLSLDEYNRSHIEPEGDYFFMRIVTVFLVTVIEVTSLLRINSKSKSNFSILIIMYPL